MDHVTRVRRPSPRWDPGPQQRAQDAVGQPGTPLCEGRWRPPGRVAGAPGPGPDLRQPRPPLAQAQASLSAWGFSNF